MKTLRIKADTCPMNPREDRDHSSVILYSSHSYLLGDKRVEQGTEVSRRDNIVLPVYAFIHSGVALNTTGFSCPWDSGQSGYIYENKAAIREEFGVKRISAKLRKRVEDRMRAEVEEFGKYLNGEVYGFVIEDENGEEVDSCWGFFGDNWEDNGLKAHIPEELHAQLEDVEVEYS
jgi:hypothetical protein